MARHREVIEGRKRLRVFEAGGSAGLCELQLGLHMTEQRLVREVALRVVRAMRHDEAADDQ